MNNQPNVLQKELSERLENLALVASKLTNKEDLATVNEFIESGTVLTIAIKEMYFDKGLISSIKKQISGKEVLDNTQEYLNDSKKILSHYLEVTSEQ